MSSEFRTRTLTALRWSAVARVLQQVLQYLTLLMLARRLGPEPYGLVGMVLVFSGFAALVAEFGFGSAIVQGKTLTDEQISSIFWINVLSGLALCLAFLGLSPFIASFYRTPALTTVARVVSITFLSGTVGIVPRALLQRAMDFRRIAIADISASILGNSVAIVLVFLHAGVFALVVGTVTSSVTTSLLLLRVARYRPLAVLQPRSVRSVLGYGGNLTGFHMVNYWSRNADNLLIGRMMGTTALGLYSRAYSLMVLPLSHIVAMVSSVMFAAMCAIQDDKPRVRQFFLRALALVALFSFPMMAGLFVVAEPFVVALIGVSWSGVVPILRIFCWVGALQSLGGPLGWIYTSQGRTDLMFRWGIGAGVALVGAIAVGALFGSVTSIAWAYCAMTTALMWPGVRIAGQLIDVGLGDVARTVVGPAICALVMALVVWGVSRVLPAGFGPWRRLLVEVAVGALVYAVTVRGARLAALEDLPSILPARVARVLLGPRASGLPAPSAEAKG